MDCKPPLSGPTLSSKTYENRFPPQQMRARRSRFHRWSFQVTALSRLLYEVVSSADCGNSSASKPGQ